MAKNLLKALFASEEAEGAAAGHPSDALVEGGEATEPGARPRSLADAFDRMADQNRRVEKRLETLEQVERELLLATAALSETAKQQLQALHYLGRFQEAAERRGREMEQQFRGVPDVLRTLPSATKEQAEKLSEIAARLYEKAQDNTVNALKTAQATHQKSIEDLIDKSLGASRRMTMWAMALAATAAGIALFIWSQGPRG